MALVHVKDGVWINPDHVVSIKHATRDVRATWDRHVWVHDLKISLSTGETVSLENCPDNAETGKLLDQLGRVPA